MEVPLLLSGLLDHPSQCLISRWDGLASQTTEYDGAPVAVWPARPSQSVPDLKLEWSSKPECTWGAPIGISGVTTWMIVAVRDSRGEPLCVCLW